MNPAQAPDRLHRRWKDGPGAQPAHLVLDAVSAIPNYGGEGRGQPQRYSDRPNLGSIGDGENRTVNQINAVMSNPQEWKQTAIILTWDDWGGFYDHMTDRHRLRGGLHGVAGGAQTRLDGANPLRLPLDPARAGRGSRGVRGGEHGLVPRHVAPLAVDRTARARAGGG